MTKNIFHAVALIFLISACNTSSSNEKDENKSLIWKSEDEEVRDVVDEFLSEINDNTKVLNDNLMTESFSNFFKSKSYYLAEKWILTAKKENDSTFYVTSKSHTINGRGRPIENVQEFGVTNVYGGWKIFNSFNLVADNLAFEVVDTQWDFYWDREKDEILKELQKKVTLEIITPSYGNPYSDSKKGELKLVNNSDYDIKDLDILIEHFDDEGKSVNTHTEYIYDVIRKHGYREFNWWTGDCSKCKRQEFKINFIKESN